MADKVPIPGSTLKRSASKTQAFKDRARESSATSLQESTRRAAREKPARRRPISPASPAQRAKVQGLSCLGCGREASDYLAIDPAHLVDRSLGGCGHRDCVVPLCRDAFGNGCHRAYDEGELDLLPKLETRDDLWRDEQAHAVKHLGIAQAYRRLTNEGRNGQRFGSENDLRATHS
jgi:hypothetical protein